MIKSIHPFPARMAPDVAIAELKGLHSQSIVLDPMTGSGTVVRHASELGYRAFAFDMDPLAVLMTKVWTTPVEDTKVANLATKVFSDTRKNFGNISLPWIENDDETKRFMKYWFAEPQRSDLTRVADVLYQLEHQRLRPGERAAVDVIKLALSRIIITKNQGASLARDVSHSRPHKVAEASNFEVIPAFERSVLQVRKLLATAPPLGSVGVALGDARNLKTIKDGEIDAILTSPPYLNAIDYMRGHRLSLVWLGFSLSDLRHIRSNSIGAERGPDQTRALAAFKTIQEAMGPMNELPRRHALMVARYAEDVYRFMSEVARVLKPEGKAIFVVGNSCLKGVFIRNSEGMIKAASLVGLKLLRQVERELPTQSRYLPIPKDVDRPLGKRMRVENILTFVPA